VAQVALQDERLQRGHRHALAVDGIGAAQAVADRQESLGQASEPLVSTPHAGGKAERHRIVERLGVLDRVVDIAGRQRSREREEAVGIGRRLVAKDPGQGQQPLAALEPREHTGAWLRRGRRLEACQIAAERVRW
jgi:hypothetical protein